MKAINICSNCGAIYENGKCEYCGSIFEKQIIVKSEIWTPPTIQKKKSFFNKLLDKINKV